MARFSLWISMCITCVILTFGGWDKAAGHSKEITQCRGNIIYEKAIRMKAPYISELHRGMVAEDYDTNDDGKVDIITLSHANGVTHNPHPVFWVVDGDFDGEFDQVYVDKRGLGNCEDIVLYQDFHAPLNEESHYSARPNPSERGGNL